jgi:hypothetical protein
MATTATMADLRELRVDQVGGLCAPADLRRAYDDYKRGDAGESIPEEDQWRKFERILETVRQVWG